MMNKDFDNKAGELLRNFRQGKGMSLRTLSEASSIDFAVLSKIEKGVRVFRQDMCEPLIEGLSF